MILDVTADLRLSWRDFSHLKSQHLVALDSEINPHRARPRLCADAPARRASLRQHRPIDVGAEFHPSPDAKGTGGGVGGVGHVHERGRGLIAHGRSGWQDPKRIMDDWPWLPGRSIGGPQPPARGG
jgi:hypothetical protein